MPDIMIFTDGSVDPVTGIGFGAYLVVEDAQQTIEVARQRVQVRQFNDTSSTRLELEILLAGLNDPFLLGNKCKLTIYTDSQNIVGLPARREHLTRTDFYSGRNSDDGKQLKNFELYQEFFKRIDQLNCEFVKVSGHQRKATKTLEDHFFSIVDKASRAALRASRSDKL